MKYAGQNEVFHFDTPESDFHFAVEQDGSLSLLTFRREREGSGDDRVMIYIKTEWIEDIIAQLSGHTGAGTHEVTEFPVEFESREQLQEALKSRTKSNSRIYDHRYITAITLLCQLRNLTIDQVSLTLDILKEFDDGEIQRALYSLQAKGLE